MLSESLPSNQMYLSSNPLLLKEGKLPVTFLLEEPLFSYANQAGPERHKIHSWQKKQTTVIKA